MAVQVQHSLPTMTYDEFLAWAGEEVRVEWVDGRVEYMEPVSDEHSEEGVFLKNTIGPYIEERQLGVIRDEPFQMKLDRPRAGRSPDLIFISTQNTPRIRNSYLDGPADVAIEIVSPESQERDRVTKFGEYERGGVREYWIIDPTIRTAEFFRLSAEGRYEAMPVLDGVFRSEAIKGLWLRIEWLWHETRPTVIHVLREWGLI